jgi:hypothetical protein
MVRSKGTRVTLLVEDRYLERFARKVLSQLRFGEHEIRVVPYLVGKNAKQWVTKEYPQQVRAHRREASRQSVALLVCTDADEQSVAQRQAALETALKGGDEAARGERERIALWIPKWHIETWLLFLDGKSVDENTSYKNALKDPDFRAAADRFVELWRTSQRDSGIDVLPAMKDAFQETIRLAT